MRGSAAGGGTGHRRRDWPKEVAVPLPDAISRHPDVVVPQPYGTHHSAHLVPTRRSWILDTDKGTNLQRLKRMGTIVVPDLSVLNAFGGAAITALDCGVPLLREGLGVGRDTRVERVTIQDLC